jgi:hypothetical protein
VPEGGGGCQHGGKINNEQKGELLSLVFCPKQHPPVAEIIYCETNKELLLFEHCVVRLFEAGAREMEEGEVA